MAISEGDDGQRESMSRLLSTLYGLDVTMLQIGNGFERLLESIDDLSLDCPNAKEVAAKFLARAIADEILPPAFVQDPQVAALAPEVLESARALLTVPHAYSKLAHCWGVSGGLNDVEELKAAVKNAILELYTSGDVEEAVRCVKGFKVPHFLHEAVYRLIILALEAYPDTRKFDLAVAFLKQTVPSVISRMQATLGFKRAAAALADLEKDAPKAGNGFRKLFAEAEKEGILAAGASETSAGAAAGGASGTA
jgi:programmed cell death protein 4